MAKITILIEPAIVERGPSTLNLVSFIVICTRCVHYFQKSGSPSSKFSEEKTFQKCNPEDFQIYLSMLTNEKFPRMV